MIKQAARNIGIAPDMASYLKPSIAQVFGETLVGVECRCYRMWGLAAASPGKRIENQMADVQTDHRLESSAFVKQVTSCRSSYRQVLAHQRLKQ